MTTIQLGSLALGAGRPKICVPLTSPTLASLLEEAAFVRTTKADLAEWRADYFEAADDAAAIMAAAVQLRQALGTLPLLFTFRTQQEGGERAIKTKQYTALNTAVAQSGAVHAMDIELSQGDAAVTQLVEAARQNGVVSVVSSHDFSATSPADVLLARFAAMHALGADLPKIAVMPHSFADVLALLSASSKYTAATGRPVAAISMGEWGRLSRVAGQYCGSVLTFGSAARPSAPGQLAVEPLATVLDILDGDLSR